MVLYMFPTGTCKRRSNGTVAVDIGGHQFFVCTAELEHCPVLKECIEAQLQKSCSGWSRTDAFVDRQGMLYSYILPFLRHGGLPSLPEDRYVRSLLVREAEFLELNDLKKLLIAHSGAPVPLRENERLSRLSCFKQFSFTCRHAAGSLEGLTRIVAASHGSPMSTISVMDHLHERVVSQVGVKARRIPRSASFSAYTMLNDEQGEYSMLIFNDSFRDARFHNNPLVVESPHIRSYSGCPLVTEDGYAIGTLSTLDTEPRTYTETQCMIQQNFAHFAMQELELVQQEHNYSPHGALPSGEGFLVALVRVGARAVDYRLLYANSVWSSATGVSLVPPLRLPGRSSAFGPGVPWQDHAKDEQPLLWMWLRLEAEPIESFHRRVKKHLQHTASDVQEIVQVRGSLIGASGESEKVLGRVVRADRRASVEMPAVKVPRTTDACAIQDDDETLEAELSRLVFIIAHRL
eukprot:TRINITY_DN67316_c0_g1_i1.p1 TRINITY_DN67316_c0_g1~~TRINITY_DN67316_c0_g1_i1.p1  ORF type:complete len:462 (+),score=55.28 TRINITY_DN67316_c0_g1_i1:72-1457(+)